MLFRSFKFLLAADDDDDARSAHCVAQYFFIIDGACFVYLI